jgi:hypothetical protein
MNLVPATLLKMRIPLLITTQQSNGKMSTVIIKEWYSTAHKLKRTLELHYKIKKHLQISPNDHIYKLVPNISQGINQRHEAPYDTIII